MSIASLLSPDRLIQISPIFRTAIASFGLALSLLIVSGAPAQANSHTANQSEMSEFAKAVKAIKDKQFQDGLTRFIALAEAGDPAVPREEPCRRSTLMRFGGSTYGPPFLGPAMRNLLIAMQVVGLTLLRCTCPP